MSRGEHTAVTPDIAAIVAKLTEALAKRDGEVAPCPYMSSRPPRSDIECKACGADASEPCRKRVTADANFVTDARAALALEQGS